MIFVRDPDWRQKLYDLVKCTVCITFFDTTMDIYVLIWIAGGRRSLNNQMGFFYLFTVLMVGISDKNFIHQVDLYFLMHNEVAAPIYQSWNAQLRLHISILLLYSTFTMDIQWPFLKCPSVNKLTTPEMPMFVVHLYSGNLILQIWKVPRPTSHVPQFYFLNIYVALLILIFPCPTNGL